MDKLILKDKTEIELSNHYGETFVTKINSYSDLDNLKDKLTDINTSIMSLQSEGSEVVITGLRLQGINTHLVRNESGMVTQILALLMFKSLDRIDQLEEKLNGRLDTISNMIAELAVSEE
jgi:hypothetical protein|nr:MAG TPA: hypothetical protein [Caudoviricetes sp.]